MNNKLSPKEEILMQLMWKNGPMLIRQMLELLPEPKPHFNTVSTFIRIMEQKGFVGHETIGHTNRYYPLITEADYSKTALDSVISRYFNNSIVGVVAALIEKEGLTDDQIEELVNLVKSQKS